MTGEPWVVSSRKSVPSSEAESESGFVHDSCIAVRMGRRTKGISDKSNIRGVYELLDGLHAGQTSDRGYRALPSTKSTC